MSEIAERLLAGMDAEVAEVVQPRRSVVASVLEAAVEQCGAEARADAVLRAVLERRAEAGSEDAAVVLAVAWARSLAVGEGWLECVAAAPDARGIAVPPLAVLVESSPGGAVGSWVAARAGAYSHLRWWLNEALPLAEYSEAELRREELVASLAAAWGCVAGEGSTVVGVAALRAAVAGTPAQAEHELRLCVARLAGHALPPGPGRPIESLYGVHTALVMQEEAWDRAVAESLELVAPGLYRGDDSHLIRQVAALALILHTLSQRQEWASHAKIADLLGNHDYADLLLERSLEERESAVATAPSAHREAALRHLVIGAEVHLAHQGTALALLAQWVRLVIDSTPRPRHGVLTPRPAEAVTVRRPEPLAPPGWVHAWRWASDLVQRHELAYAEDCWDHAAMRGIVAVARYAVLLDSAEGDEEAVLARLAWLLIDADATRFCRVVPGALARAGHDLDQVDLRDAVSVEWAWLHQEWPDHPEQPMTTLGPRWDGMTRGIARGLPYCAMHVVMQPWAVGVIARELEQRRGAIHRYQRVRITGGEHARRCGYVEFAVWADTQTGTIQPGPPPAYRVSLDTSGDGATSAVVAAEQLSTRRTDGLTWPRRPAP